MYTYNFYEIPHKIELQSNIHFLPKNIVQIKVGHVEHKYYILKQLSENEYILSKGINDFYLCLNNNEATLINTSNQFKVTLKN